jgi:hypothetical protein
MYGRRAAFTIHAQDGLISAGLVMPFFFVFAAFFGLLLLLKHTRVGDWLNLWVGNGEPRRLQNPVYAVLRRETEIFGREMEALPYERLLELEDMNSGLGAQYRVVDGFNLAFSSDALYVGKNGDVVICIDASSPDLRWWWFRALPSYEFTKRPDGTVYYGEWPK